MMRTFVVAAMVGAFALGGCAETSPNASPDPTQSSSPPTASKTTPPPHVAFPVGSTAKYALRVHCGVRYAVVDGSNWETDWRPLGVSENENVNPPDGWGDEVAGTLSRPTSDRLVFMSPKIPETLKFRRSELPFPGCD